MHDGGDELETVPAASTLSTCINKVRPPSAICNHDPGGIDRAVLLLTTNTISFCCWQKLMKGIVGVVPGPSQVTEVGGVAGGDVQD